MVVADTLSLAGKVAIVTGSGRENGIGAAIATTLARNGASVVIHYVSSTSTARAENVANNITRTGGKAIVVRADLSTLEGAQKLTEETLKGFETDKIDILVNNAGYGNIHSTLDVPIEDIHKIVGINLYGPFYLNRTVVPHMPHGGRIINISSIVSKVGPGSMPVYGATKAALDNLTYSWAEEFGKSRGITVNSIAPGFVATDLTEDLVKVDSVLKGIMATTRAADRIGTTEDVADAVLLLVSEKSRWITGQWISVSGGMTG
ncbi:NAD(P)-binding protein [Microthyrium microscopicum]|uniref:NAD(P)-binding protein n=1 Tax=Microthyrium microscopicum TaxID=703497 RepID=A0A6A6U7X8_9PEZI|nr:NAD(P)-binding protein [Microthyrium microscopicum]